MPKINGFGTTAPFESRAGQVVRPFCFTLTTVIMGDQDRHIDESRDHEKRDHENRDHENRDHDRSVSRITSGSPFESTIGFSRAIRVGNRILVSGTAPIWPDGSCDERPAHQAQRCFEIIGEALVAAGSKLDDVVRTRMFITSPHDADAIGAVHGQVFATIRPAATMLVVAGLLDPRWKVEIEAEAEISR